ncbi:MAG: hypothetical protein IPG25_15645 [Proteobacteria bacterium]|nr:hypothetical protein [Pseudomonadota bacterium]
MKLAQFAFRREEAAPTQAEDGRVVELFRSRSELRKQHDDLQSDLNRQRDRLKQQEAATQRVRDMLDVLEGRLGSADTGYPALAFYHLRTLWGDGRELIQAFVTDLANKQAEREREVHDLGGNKRQFEQRKVVEARLHAAQIALVDARLAIQGIESQLQPLTRWWQKKRRAEIAKLLPAAQESSLQAEQALDQAHADISALDARKDSYFPGLAIGSRRAINLAAIAYAEVLCLRLIRTPLLQMARAAVARREVIDEYGSPAECQALMADVEHARKVLGVRTGLAKQVAPRVERLKKTAKYRSSVEVVPVAESVTIAEGDALELKAVGANATRLPNVVAEDIWDLFGVLLK